MHDCYRRRADGRLVDRRLGRSIYQGPRGGGGAVTIATPRHLNTDWKNDAPCRNAKLGVS